MLQSFNVLDRDQNIHGSRLLEASAGTGKTFAIENIVVRLMIEEPIDGREPLSLNQILVVTFTNPATYDLKIRIRTNIIKSIRILSDSLKGKHSLEIPDYLQTIVKDADHSRRAKRKLEQALACFEEAPIFTIHSFCSRMLREYVLEGGQVVKEGEIDGRISPIKLRSLIKDFFLTEIRSDSLTKKQLELVLKDHKQAEGLEKNLYKIINTWMDIALDFEPLDLFKAFLENMSQLKKKTAVTSEQMVQEFVQAARHYKGICPQSDTNPKLEILRQVERVARLLDKDAWDQNDFDILLTDGSCYLECLSPDNIKKKVPSDLKTSVYEEFNASFVSIIKSASDPDVIFAWMAKKCRKLILDYLNQEELVTFDMILHSMKDALKNPSFVEKIGRRFKAAIVDEFQDTDPVQWEIFKQLFMNENSLLYLVGDPKQSIYAFRQADIYTYLKASAAMGIEKQSSLDTNYRSQPSMVEALNALFDSREVPGLIALPRTKNSLTYHPVKAGAKPLSTLFKDDLGSVHFFVLEYQKNKEKAFPKEIMEDDHLFPFIAQEILKLHRDDQIQYKQFAVLVKDRFQAQRLMSYLDELNIPTSLQRSSSLAESKALYSLKELLQGILTPRDESALKTALGGPIIGFTHQDILGLSDPKNWEKILSDCYALRKIWYEDGFAVFFEHLMQGRWLNNSKSVGEHLLLQERGIEFYQDLLQIAEMLIEYEAEVNLSPIKCLEFLNDFDKLNLDEDPRLNRRSDPNRDAVKVLTLHASKGLEFDIVFALGLFNRTIKQDSLIPDLETYAEPKLAVVADKSDPRYLQFCEEIDAEKIRQLYVALTRAKYRLYIPAIFYKGGSVIEPGVASAMELYLARIGHSGKDSADIYAKIADANPAEFYKFLEKLELEHDVTSTRLHEHKFQIQADVLDDMPELFLATAPLVPGKPRYMHSFTTLSKHGSSAETYLPGQETPPHDYACNNKTSHTLPSGSETGILLHEILEKISFNSIQAFENPLQMHSNLKRFLDNTPYDAWIEVISGIIYNSLKVDLGIDVDSFSISNLKEGSFYREHEFLYSDKSADNPLENDLFKGIIDLMFTHHGKYYLLDWKSNWLGPSSENYDVPSMERAMHDHQYFLQARLYKDALKRYLRVIDKRNFEDIFGGIIYVFMRGVNASNTNGIYQVPVEE